MVGVRSLKVSGHCVFQRIFLGGSLPSVLMFSVEISKKFEKFEKKELQSFSCFSLHRAAFSKNFYILGLNNYFLVVSTST